MPQNVTTVKELDTSPEIAHLKDKKDKTDQKDKTDLKEAITKDLTVLNATTVNNLDIWPKIAISNKLQRNATTAKSLDTSQEIVLKEVTKSLVLNATNVTKSVILPEIAKVIFEFI